MAVAPFRRGFAPWHDLQRIRDEMDRLIGSTFGVAEGERAAELGWTPAMDVVERPDEFEIRMELPGMRREDIHVEMQDRMLTIRGEKREEKERRDERRRLVERSFGGFTRSLTLPQAVDAERIHARFENGVLRVTLPKVEEQKGRQIRVEGGH